MFSGIITNISEILEINYNSNACELIVVCPADWEDLVLGESIAVNGICLTIVDFSKTNIKFQLAPETVNRTIIPTCKIKDFVNLERSLKVGDRISGHFVFGHIDGKVQVKEIVSEANSYRIFFEIPVNYSNLILEKGSIAINGVSLTIASRVEDNFSVVVIPHTWQNTNLFNLKPKDYVNYEIDMLARYCRGFTNA